MFKAINMLLGVVVTLSAWGAVILLAILTFHVLVLCGVTVYHLLQS